MAYCGQLCTICVKPGSFAFDWLTQNPRALRKGMVLVKTENIPKAYREFLIELYLFDNSNMA